MAYKLRFRDDARDDIVNGYKWYEDKKEGLGIRFIDEVEMEIDYISKYPEHFQIKTKNKYREAILKIFPYVIIYEIIKKKNEVIVYSVFPTKDDPQKKP